MLILQSIAEAKTSLGEGQTKLRSGVVRSTTDTAPDILICPDYNLVTNVGVSCVDSIKKQDAAMPHTDAL
jgi:hypothetical protein